MRENTRPLHVAIIMDGNGRWAKNRAMPRAFGHKEGVKTVKKIVEHAAELKIANLSMFAFSIENWLRPKEEVSFLMGLLHDYAKSEGASIIKNNIKFIVSGDTRKLPKKTLSVLNDLINDTKANTGMILNLAISYGSKDEICDAAKLAAADVKEGKISLDEITPHYLRSKFYNANIPDIDLLIRTSGEHRISNFMLWQLAYAELYFTDKLWPDFNENDFDDALDDFSKRVRRFGKTDEQLKSGGDDGCY